MFKVRRSKLGFLCQLSIWALKVLCYMWHV